jgi:hypothetical protein
MVFFGQWIFECGKEYCKLLSSVVSCKVPYVSLIHSDADLVYVFSQENPRQFHIKAGLQKLKPPRYVEKVYCNDPPTNDPPSDESPSDDPSSTLYGLFDL